jgi:hypothetical protein
MLAAFDPVILPFEGDALLVEWSAPADITQPTED